MNSREQVLNTLQLMRDFEKLLGQAYSAAAKMFPEHAEFWNRISVDENTHAFMVDTFISLYKSKDIAFQNRPFVAENIERDIAAITEFLARAEKDKVSLSAAIDFALSAEGSIIERSVFKFDRNDQEDFKKFLVVLHEDSLKHYQRIKSFAESHMG